MLREAAAALAARSRRTTSIARTERSLRRLDELLGDGSALHHLLALDWSRTEVFLDAIRRHIEATAPPDLVVAWIHGLAPGLRLAERLPTAPAGTRFFHVIGSATRDPSLIARTAAERLRHSEGFLYRQVILGAGGGGDWLTDEEISRGVLQAVEADRPRFLVGSLARWQGSSLRSAAAPETSSPEDP